MQIPPTTQTNGQPTFGYRWYVKTLYQKGKLPTVKVDMSGRKLTKTNVTNDHIIPKSRGGKLNDGNLALATDEFNQLRGSKHLLEVTTFEKIYQYLEQFIDVVVDNFNGNKYIQSVLKTLRKSKDLY